MSAFPVQICLIVMASLASGVAARPALAEIKDYQIARMLNFRTECHLMALSRLPSQSGEAERFFGECGNLVSYPDGVEITCPEPDDEWACKVLTDQRSFDDLDLLKREP